MLLLTGLLLLRWTWTSLATPLTLGVGRDHYGDIFELPDCNATEDRCGAEGRQAAPVASRDCECQCAPAHQAYRQDTGKCVRDLEECSLASFIRTYTTERIPLVFLPMTGQLVSPGAHLSFPGQPWMEKWCQVNGTDLMSETGWERMDQDRLFALYRDGEKTFLQWLGTDDDRRRLQHGLILIRLLCEVPETEQPTPVEEYYQRTARQLEWHPCAAVRVGWSPGLEMSEESSKQARGGGSSSGNNQYIIIGLCLGILGLIYVMALLVYLRIRQAKRLEAIPFPRDEEDQLPPHGNGLSGSHGSKKNGKLPSSTLDALPSNGHTRTGSGRTRTDKSYHHSHVAHHHNHGHSHSHRGHQRNHHQQNGKEYSLPERVSRRNLYLHPELFEPEFLASPPPPAQEFLHRVRDMIANARARLRNFRFRPTLVVIPEDDYFYQDFKEREAEPSKTVNGNGASYPKVAPTAVESIHGQGIGSVLVESHNAIDTPHPPPRSTRSRQKNRAPPPPVGAKLNTETPTPIITEPDSSLSKFDKFRLDLYDKLKHAHETDTVVLEAKAGQELSGEWSADDVPATGELWKSAGQPVHTKVSRHELIRKLQEDQPNQSEAEVEVYTETRSGNCIITEVLDVEPLPEVTSLEVVVNSRREIREEPSRLTQVVVEVEDKALCPATPYDSLDSRTSRAGSESKRRATKNLCLIQDGVLSSEPSRCDGESENGDVDKCCSEDEEETFINESEHPSLEEFLQLSNQVAKKLSERGVPELQEDAVTITSTSTASSACIHSEKDKNSITQFMRDFRNTLGRWGANHFELSRGKSPPHTSKPAATDSDNWMLRKESESQGGVMCQGRKIIRKLSLKSKKQSNKSAKKSETISESDGDVGRSENETARSGSENEVCTRKDKNGLSRKSSGTTCDTESEATVPSEFDPDSLQRSTTKRSSPAREVADDGGSELTDSESVCQTPSELTDDSLNVAADDCSSNVAGDLSLGDCEEYDSSPLEACLNMLASTPLELVIGGRASKGLDVTQHFKTAQWQHICVDKLKNAHEDDHKAHPECTSEVDPIKEAKAVFPVPDWVTSNSEDEDSATQGATSDNQTPTSSGAECSSLDGESKEKRRNKLFTKHAKIGINGTCKQFIRNRKNNKLSNGLTRYKNGSSGRPKAVAPAVPCAEGGDQHLTGGSGEVTIIQLGLEAVVGEEVNVTQIESGENFVTLIAVDSSECSNEEDQ